MTDKQVHLLHVTSENETTSGSNNNKLIPSNSCNENCGTHKLPPVHSDPEDSNMNDNDNNHIYLVKNAWQDDGQLKVEDDSKSSCRYTSLVGCQDNQGGDIKNLSKSWKFKAWIVLFQFFSTTSFHGLPYIASNHRSCFRITFWIIIFLLSLGLMAAAITSVTAQYTNQNTILSSKHHFHKMLPFPAVTICNKNLNRKSVAVDSGINLNDLTVFLNLLLDDHPYLNFVHEGFNYTTFIDNNSNLLQAENSVFYHNNSGHQLENMFFSCGFAGLECFPVNFTQRVSTYGNCYTFNSGQDRSILSSVSNGQRYGLELVLNAEEYEYFQAESDSVGFNVFIHDPDHFPFFRASGSFSASPGQLTQVSLRRIDSKLLTKSQGGQCDDVTLKYFNSYSQESCIAECVTDFIVKECGCKPQYMPGPAEVCKLLNSCRDDSLNLFTKDTCNCPIECESTIYQTTLSHGKFPAAHFVRLLNHPRLIDYLPVPDFVVNSTVDENGKPYQYLNENFTESFITNNYAKILIYYDSLRSTSVEEGLEYSTAQFLIDFGGYIGLFTGAGFLTLFELFELVLNFLTPIKE